MGSEEAKYCLIGGELQKDAQSQTDSEFPDAARMEFAQPQAGVWRRVFHRGGKLQDGIEDSRTNRRRLIHHSINEVPVQRDRHFRVRAARLKCFTACCGTSKLTRSLACTVLHSFRAWASLTSSL